MNLHYRQIGYVARWEFFRFFKPRDQLLTLVLFSVGGLVGWGSAKLGISAQDNLNLKIAVIHQERLPLGESPGFTWTTHDEAELPALREQVQKRDLDGILNFGSDDRAELYVRKDPYWKPQLEGALQTARMQHQIQTLKLDPAQLAQVMTPIALELMVDKETAAKANAAKILAVIFISLMMLCVFQGLSLFLIGITSEKQNRVTEQVVAAVSPQTWIDGKLLGITAVILVTTLVNSVGGLLFYLVYRLTGGEMPLPSILASPPLMLGLILLTLSGILFWNCFFAGVAALINDPNTSTRGPLLFLPLLPVFVAYFALGNPDAPLFRVLALIPITAPPVLSARLALTEVPWWEVPLALIIMGISIAMLRRFVGKIFALGILMTGKEPSWREIRTMLAAA